VPEAREHGDAAAYVAECFLPGLTRTTVEVLDARAKQSAEALTLEGKPVRYLGSTLFPSDEVVFFEFEGASAEVVRQASERAELPFERIIESIHVRQTEARTSDSRGDFRRRETPDSSPAEESYPPKDHGPQGPASAGLEWRIVMAIAVELNYPGVKTEQYDEVIRKMGATPGGRHPGAGALFHWVSKTSDGIRVVDVWASREEFERFAADQIRPVGEEVGLPEPELRFSDVHNYFVAN
jgi:hypothetical protein